MSTAVLRTPNDAVFVVPAGACDCHVHAYDDAYPLAPTATFKPPHAPMANYACLLYTSPSPRDRTRSRMPSSA